MPAPAVDRGYVVDLAQRLVAVDTQNPPGRNYRAVADLLATELTAAGLAAEVIPVPADEQRRVLPGTEAFPRCNVVARLERGAARTLHFNAHFDVVPASEGDGWATPPFEPTARRGWLHGRGTADMKGAIASILGALRAVTAARAPTPCNLEVSFVCDEETGSELGAAWLLRTGRIRPDFAVVGEGAEGLRICAGHNGTLWFDVECRGRPAHASLPHRGRSAFDALCAVADALRRHHATVARRAFKAPDGTVLRPTQVLGGTLRGSEGGKINTVPALAACSLDRRVTPGEDISAVERDLRRIATRAARGHAGVRLQMRLLEKNPPCLTDWRGPFAQALAAVVREVRGGRPRFGVSTGFNDMHWFARAGIPVFGYGPGGLDFHGVNERARIEDLHAAAAIYLRLMTTFGG